MASATTTDKDVQQQQQQQQQPHEHLKVEPTRLFESKQRQHSQSDPPVSITDYSLTTPTHARPRATSTTILSAANSSSSSSDGLLRATIPAWESHSLWGKDWTEYIIEVEFQRTKWETSRRYREFYAFHQQLEETMPKEVRRRLPKLPSRALRGNDDPKFIEERREELDKYIRQLIQIPECVAMPVTLVFLGAMEDHTAESSKMPNVKSRLHLDRMMAMIDSGDVILFHTPGVMQAMQRSLTSSSYDHVGIVVRNPPLSASSTSLYILEATADGVRAYPLKGRLRAWHLTKAHVSMRQLVVPERTLDMRQNMVDFMMEMDGKDYGLNTFNFLRKRSVSDKDSYFCSEVVAACYKRLGLLPGDVSSNTYLPGSFGEAANLQLLNDAKLGPEILIVFKTPDVSRAEVVEENSDSNSNSNDEYRVYAGPNSSASTSSS